ncbi:MAG: shikimate dehydrogenase [Pseudomonadota bacterium]
MTDRRIPLAGVIGSPIAHSKSPKLHNYWLRKYDLPGHYVPLDISHGDLADALAMMPKLGFVGANVTIPHKEAILGLADLVSDRASLIGAANTLTFQPNGKIHADNTDGIGFLENVRHNAPEWRPKDGPAAVIGAGGAARAVLSALLEAGVPEIRLTNRTRTRSDALRDEFGTRIKVFDWVRAGNAIDGAAMVVNTSSLGMSGSAEFRVPLDGLRRDAVVNDLVYTPLETGFLRSARARGCTIVDGLGMLLYQAAPGFERWFGHRPDVDEDTRKVVLGS